MLVIVTVVEEEVQGALEMVHWKTLAPAPKAVTPEVDDDGVVIVPIPLTSVHIPVPTTGVFPAKVADELQSV